jgi:hypothetical protein
MRLRTKVIVAVPAVVLGLGAGYYWHYVRPAVEAEKVFREGLRLYEEAKSEDGGEFNSKYEACIARLSATLQQPPRRVPVANRVRAVEILGAIGEKYWEDEGNLWVFLAPGFPVTSPVVEVLGNPKR